MKHYDPATLKIYRRLRNAYRRAMTVEIRKGDGKANAEAAKRACGRITIRAVKLGWLELPNKSCAGTVHP